MDLQKVQPTMDCLDCHDGELTELHVDIDEHLEDGCLTCHTPHTWVVPDREACYQCHDDKEEHNAGDACYECHDFI